MPNDISSASLTYIAFKSLTECDTTNTVLIPRTSRQALLSILQVQLLYRELANKDFLEDI